MTIPAGASRITEILNNHESELLQEWLAEQRQSGAARPDLIPATELQEQGREFVALLRQAAQSGDFSNIQAPAWSGVRDLITELSRTRARLGFTPTEVATFVFSFKQPLFSALQRAHGDDSNSLLADIWTVTKLLDKLGLLTTESYMKSREEIIARHQEEMMELSTPVVQLWQGIVALPIIGTLDSARTQIVMENLLQAIVDTGSETAIIDITGVPTVDTLVSQHLLKTVAAARLMGAECIISGIRPQIAQTIVHLGVELTDVTTKATLASAFALALQRRGMTVGKVAQFKS
ncbi:polyvinyl alcohol dehydrogenase [Capsulimonas corticalis]|uniref:Polyvinyl alcohol dehydrogenase n=1 Tax=Capsulimonas corticalis TaxID=2219043 RepID=A0A402D309_9BACT|nr:STAS domain-containing protein [Capsulimonas corticalis]BDI28385.1 polyvinyl alcohol dehydrogenase [Capsulimonas corticalis]